MKRYLASICFLLPFICCKIAVAQSNEVCGFVKHYFDKTPIAEVILYIENTVVTTTTDEAGAFCLNLTENQNKIWVEKEGYFKTYIMAKSGDFLSIEMIKNSEQDLAVSQGLSIENITDLNTTTSAQNATVRGSRSSALLKGDKKMSFDADFTPSGNERSSPTLSTSSMSDKSKKIGSPRGVAGAPGAAGAPKSVRSSAAAPPPPPPPSPSSKMYGSELEPEAIFDIPVLSERKTISADKKGRSSVADVIELAEEKSIQPKKKIKAGRLTAGEIHDFSKWALWNDLSDNELSKYKDIWSLYPKERYVIQAVTEQGFPVVDATVTLNVEGETLWQAKTDNTGKAELWNVLFEEQTASKNENAQLKASINYKGTENNLPQLKRFEEGLNVITFKQACNYAKNVDIAFVVDATGSMGDEIDYLKVELLDVIDRVQTEFEDLNIRLGNVFYRDKTDAYLTKNSPLTQNIKAGVAFIKDQQAGGGGDFPEAVDVGLEEAVNTLQWANKAVARILFLVLDAPPHQNEAVNKRLQQTMSEAAKKGIRIVPVVGSGIDKSTEYLLRSCALATNGHYIFLTDHSGIGGAHLKPSTDSYDVKNLNDLLVDIVLRYVQVPDCEDNNTPNVPEPVADSKIQILPNPNDGRFLIKTQTDLKELFITDTNGKILVRFTDFETGENQVDIANFPTGTYYVRYQKDGKVHTEKVIVKR